MIKALVITIKVSNQLISLASRETSLLSSPTQEKHIVSNQLISLASRECGCFCMLSFFYPFGVSNQLISLASRE